MKLLEVHVIQTLAPNNLNRDDTGSPKDALFGGFRRARISSQAQKRAIRLAFKEFFNESELAIRTKRVVEELTKELQKAGFPEEQAKLAIKEALNILLRKEDQKEVLDDNGKTIYPLFLGKQELSKLGEFVQQHFQQLASQNGQGIQAGIRNKIFDGGKAVDLALFGRMIANRPEIGVEAAAQVAHALSTHKVDREFDYYTAVDDLSPKEEPGADMIGDVEFYSATMYRYAVVSLDLLLRNLQGDRELAQKAALAFLKAFICTLPSGKQNGFAAHNQPLFAAFRAGEGLPRNLVTAFEKPISPQPNKALSTLSVRALLKEWEKMDKVYGPLQDECKGAYNMTEAKLKGVVEAVNSLEDLAAMAEEALRRLM